MNNRSGARGHTGHRIGEWHGRAKWPDETVRSARELYAEGLSYASVGYRRRLWNWIPARKFHRISSVITDTWTLFVHGPHRKGWGFLDPIKTEDGATALLYHNPHDQSDSAGAHWWARPDCLSYPPEGVR